MKQSILNEFRLTVLERDLQVYGVHVYQAGEGSVSHRFHSDDRECLYSASKTFTSMGVGICQDEGRIKLSDHVLDYFPEYQEIASEGSGDITLRDLLHMSSGKEVMWFVDTTESQPDYAEQFFRLPMDHRPGEVFYYSNACTYLLGRVIEKVSGEKLRDYLIPRLFTPFGIANPQWHCCPQEHTLGGTGLYLKTDELANIGRLMLQRGEFDGKQLVSAAYVDAMHQDVVDSRIFSADEECRQGYGYQVWRCTEPGTFRADGMYGQFSIVIPEKQAVVTATSHNERCANDIIRAIFHDILPHL